MSLQLAAPLAPAPHEASPGPGPLADLAAALRGLVPVLDTPRTRLRAPGLADFPAWAAILCSPRAVHMDGPYERDDAFMEFAAAVGSWLLRGHGAFAVEDRATGAPLGFVLLGLEPGDHEPELGFFVLPEAEGRGLAHEAAEAALAWAKAQGLPALVSYVDPANARSIRLAERLGGRRDGAAEAAFAGTEAEGVGVWRHLPQSGPREGA